MSKSDIMNELMKMNKPFKIGMKQLAKDTGRSEWALWNIFNGKHVDQKPAELPF